MAKTNGRGKKKVPFRGRRSVFEQLSGTLAVQQAKTELAEAAAAEPALKPLSEREEKFLQMLVEEDGKITPRRMVILAGWPSTEASQVVATLLNPEHSPHFIRALQGARKELEAMHAVTRHRHLRDLKEIRDKAMDDGKWGAAVQAEYRRGQVSEDGLYVARSEVRTGSLDSMSREEVQREIERLQREYVGLRTVVAVDPGVGGMRKALEVSGVLEGSEGFEGGSEQDSEGGAGQPAAVEQPADSAGGWLD